MIWIPHPGMLGFVCRHLDPHEIGRHAQRLWQQPVQSQDHSTVNSQLEEIGTANIDSEEIDLDVS